MTDTGTHEQAPWVARGIEPGAVAAGDPAPAARATEPAEPAGGQLDPRAGDYRAVFACCFRRAGEAAARR
jgi:hypothetical protein